MDMAYLLWLQDLRSSIEAALGSKAVSIFFEELSLFAITWLIFIPVFVYWAVNKKDGLFLLASMGISWFFNGFVKMTACAYRPWIRDARIIPAGDAMKTAGGYSFPSGHTMWSSPVYGGLAVLTKKRAPMFACLCVILLLLTAFSRNYLGVHTPQDVVVGVILGLCSVWLASRILANPGKENMIMLIGLVLCIADLLYIMYKPYPMDYTAEGRLLVDPVAMMNGPFHGIGMLLALIVGRCLEREYVKFESTGLGLKGIVLLVIGFIPYYFLVFSFVKRTFIINTLAGMLTKRWAYMVLGFLTVFWAIFVWPCVIKLTGGKK
ncbi:MAG: phosphatase PAP2 family protein [Synergistaceae bacterium]|nr:phosphatase PAP2 family protein [Synergistaceae bacterium]